MIASSVIFLELRDVSVCVLGDEVAERDAEVVQQEAIIFLRSPLFSNKGSVALRVQQQVQFQPLRLAV